MQNKFRKNKYDLGELEKEAAAVCQDFAVFCGYIVENKVKTSKKTGNIGKKDCFAINALMHISEKYEKPSYFQGQYPVINLCFYVSVKYKILEVSPDGTALQRGRNFQYFWEASVWEQYVLLLSVVLFDGRFAGRENSWYSVRVADVWEMHVDGFMEWVAGEKPPAGVKCRLSRGSGIRSFYDLAYVLPYLEGLNLIKIWEKPDSGTQAREYEWEIEAQPLLEMVSDLYENTDIAEDEDTTGQDSEDTDHIVKYYYEAFMEKLAPENRSGCLLKMFEKPGIQNH